MKKKIASLFAAVLVLAALAGCGSKVNDHVVDYKLDIPDGFTETELEGVDACWMDADGTANINLGITAKEAGTDVTFKAATADMLREAVVDSMKQAYGEEPAITDRYFTKNDVSGLTAYQYSYDMTLAGQDVSQIIVSINADKTYTFTYTTSDAGMLAVFDESAKNIQLVIE